MATLKFARGTTVPSYSTSKFDDGCLYFNTSNQKIYLRNGSSSSTSTVVVFNGQNTHTTQKKYNKTTNTYSDSELHRTNAYIQPLPTGYPTGDDLLIDGAKTWYELFGQGLVTTQNMYSYSRSMGIDEALADHKPGIPPLDTAKYIVCAVSAFYIGLAATGGTGTAITNLTTFPSSPQHCIVTCYRTDHSSYADAPAEYLDNRPMFIGHCSPAQTGYMSGRTNTLQLDLSLCCNGTNSIYVHGRVDQIDDGSVTHSDFTSYSESYMRYTNGHPDIEKYVYPLYIQY